MDSVDAMQMKLSIDYMIFEDGFTFAKRVESHQPYLRLRKKLNHLRNDKGVLRQQLQDNLAKSYGQVNLTRIEYKNLDDKYQPLIMENDFDITSFATVSDGEMKVQKYFPFHLVDRNAPLSVKERQYPVAIDAENIVDRTLTYHAPSGYAWDTSALNDVSIDTRFGKYSRVVQVDGETLMLHEKIAILPQYIELNDYAAFRDFCLAVDEAQRVELRAKQ